MERPPEKRLPDEVLPDGTRIVDLGATFIQFTGVNHKLRRKHGYE